MPPSNQPNTSSSCRRQPPRHVTDGGNRTLLKERLVPTCNPPLNQHRTQLANKQATLNDDDDAMPPIDQPLPLTDDFPLLAEHSAPLADYSEHAVCDRRSTSMTHHLPTTTRTPSVVTVRRGIPAVRRPRASPHPRMAKIRLFSCSTASSWNNCDAHVGTWDKRPVGGMSCGMWHLASCMSRIAYAWLRAASRQPERHVKRRADVRQALWRVLRSYRSA